MNLRATSVAPGSSFTVEGTADLSSAGTFVNGVFAEWPVFEYFTPTKIRIAIATAPPAIHGRYLRQVGLRPVRGMTESALMLIARVDAPMAGSLGGIC